jgi:transposase
MEVATIGFDIAKNVFQVHGADERGRPVLRRRLRRGEVLPFFAKLSRCLVGMEACSTAHFWAREIGALGHEVKLIPAKYVKPYIQRGKSDAADAAGICEAVTRPTMRFAAVKSVEQQSVLVLHRVRDLLVKQRTMLANAIRGNLGEFGVIGPLGLNKVDRLVDVVDDEDDGRVPGGARAALRVLAAELEEVRARIRGIEAEILAWHRSNAASVRLATIPGVGPITASAIVATVADASAFKSARHFAAFLGLTPKQHSSGEKERLGRVSKKGDDYIRRLLVIGSAALLRYARGSAAGGWATRLLQRRPALVVTVALANKRARIAWALLARGGVYTVPAS